MEFSMEAQPITEEMIQWLMAIWPGKLPHKRAKVKLEYSAKQGCLLCSDCAKCPKVRECPILDLNDVKED